MKAQRAEELASTQAEIDSAKYAVEEYKLKLKDAQDLKQDILEEKALLESFID